MRGPGPRPIREFGLTGRDLEPRIDTMRQRQ